MTELALRQYFDKAGQEIYNQGRAYFRILFTPSTQQYDLDMLNEMFARDRWTHVGTFPTYDAALMAMRLQV